MMRAKGKLVAPRRGKKSTEAERRARALDRAKSILGQSEFDRVQTLFQSMNVVGNKVDLYWTVLEWVYYNVI